MDSASLLTDSVETSKAKVTVEMSQSSVKMRAAAQLPAIGPDDDLTSILLQVHNTCSSISRSSVTLMLHHFTCFCFVNIFRYSP